MSQSQFQPEGRLPGAKSQQALADLDDFLAQRFSAEEQIAVREMGLAPGYGASDFHAYLQGEGYEGRYLTVYYWQRRNRELGELAREVNAKAIEGVGIEPGPILEVMLAKNFGLYYQVHERLSTALAAGDNESAPRIGIRSLTELGKEVRAMGQFLQERDSQNVTYDMTMDGALALFARLLDAAKEAEDDMVYAWLGQTGRAVLQHFQSELRPVKANNRD